MKWNVFFFCVLHIFQNFPCTLGEKSKSVSFSRVYVCVKAKLTLVSFFLLFYFVHLPLSSLQKYILLLSFSFSVFILPYKQILFFSKWFLPFFFSKKYFPSQNIFLLFLLSSSSPPQTSIFLLQIFKSQTFLCPEMSTVVRKSSFFFITSLSIFVNWVSRKIEF